MLIYDLYFSECRFNTTNETYSNNIRIRRGRKKSVKFKHPNRLSKSVKSEAKRVDNELREGNGKVQA